MSKTCSFTPSHLDLVFHSDRQKSQRAKSLQLNFLLLDAFEHFGGICACFWPTLGLLKALFPGSSLVSAHSAGEAPWTPQRSGWERGRWRGESSLGGGDQRVASKILMGLKKLLTWISSDPRKFQRDFWWVDSFVKPGRCTFKDSAGDELAREELASWGSQRGWLGGRTWLLLRKHTLPL